MPTIRNWTKAVAEARITKVFTEEERRDCEDFRYCLIAEINKKAGRELQTIDPIIADLGYAFCAAVVHNEAELAHYVKNAIDKYCKKYYGVKYQ